MTRVAVRLDKIEARYPVPSRHRAYDLNRLTDEQLDRLAVLTERIAVVGPDGLTPDEMEEAAELAAILEGPEEP